MLKGPLVTAVVAIAAFAVVIFSFSQNASPYVTGAQARKISGERLHLAGDIQKDTVRVDLMRHTLDFQIKDADGAPVHVVYQGEPPNNLQEATKVVAIGHMVGSDFQSSQLLLKCPTKYEPEKKTV